MILEQQFIHQNGNTPIREPAHPAPSLRVCALAALATQMIDLLDPESTQPELRYLFLHLQNVGGSTGWQLALERALITPLPGDAALVEVGEWLGLSDGELLTVALTAAVEEDAMIGRVLAYLQQPMGGSRPTLGLLARAFAGNLQETMPPIYGLINGAAIRSGLLTVLNEGAPLPERTLAISQTLGLALYGMDSAWHAATLDLQPVPLPQALLAEARQRGDSLNQSNLRLLTVRGAELEGRTITAEIAAGLGKRPLFLQLEAPTAGLGVFMHLLNLLPVFCCNLAPAEQKILPAIPFYNGPYLAVCGTEGALELSGQPSSNWTLPMPNRAERTLLWQSALQNESLAAELAHHHRHSSGRIAQLGQVAHYQARLRGADQPNADDLLSAAWHSDSSGLATLAQPLSERIPDEALVATAALRRDLDSLLLRCRSREGLVTGLGASAQARYRPGVRSLFVGASGAGKTLAVGWLATQLRLPLFRVDLAAVTSKYIGETEKNLAQLLARAEQSEVILLFDEADSLFGKRTDVNQSNDRFANAQTNYLLQRIESYDGIAILTSNSRSRFDPAFMRRLDLIIDFPTPGPQERRALWLSHLGNQQRVDGQQINRLAAACDLAGGHIRNVVLSAAVLAQSQQRPIEYADLLAGLGDEYRKVGRQLPVEL